MGRLFNKMARKVMAKYQGTSLEQEMNAGRADGKMYSDAIVPFCRQAAAEGIVLLKNENDTLPIAKTEKVAVFGRCARNYFGVGYGSGGDVCRPYLYNLYDGFDQAGVLYDRELAAVYDAWIANPKNEPDEGFWGNWPMNFPEMPLEDALVKKAAENNDLAVVVIARAAGEDRENLLKPGSYYLTKAEKKMLAQVTGAFRRVALVLDCGNVIDLGFLSDYRIDALVMAWQGGMESGTALTDILTGSVNPSGRLTDTIAKDYKDLPSANYFGGKKFNNYVEDIFVGYRYFETFAKEQILFPFGFGLSYTEFSMQAAFCAEGDSLSAKVSVTNTGSRSGKQVVQIYGSAPQGKLGKPAVSLLAFAKTEELAPKESQELTLTWSLKDMASYDDIGVEGFMDAFILEAGDYHFYLGKNASELEEIGCQTVEECRLVKQCEPALPITGENTFSRMIYNDGKPGFAAVPITKEDLKARILDRMPEEITAQADHTLDFEEVRKNPELLDAFIAQMSNEDLADLTMGEGPMNSPFGTVGNAGAFGGITEALRAKGIAPMVVADGPSGVRVKRICSLLPCGTALASSFNSQLTEQLYSQLGAEVKHYGLSMLLAPGMNIHRNPLCGRNFEYYSEDPLVSGKMAAAAIRGLQSNGISACPKHFACNNQETRRNTNDSRVSQRALREIYLKNFEIMLKESAPRAIMTSYNKINGVWNHYNYDLATTILRKEWGYQGLVITDWWMQPDVSHEFSNVANEAYRIRSRVDVDMPGSFKPGPGAKVNGNILDSFGQPEGLTRGELQIIAKDVLKFILEAE